MEKLQSNITGQTLLHIKTMTSTETKSTNAKTLNYSSFLNKHPRENIYTSKNNQLSYSTLSARTTPFPHWEANFRFILNKSNNLHPGKCKIHSKTQSPIPHFLQKIIFVPKSKSQKIPLLIYINQPTQISQWEWIQHFHWSLTYCILVFDINYKHGVINIFSPKQKAELSFVLYIMGKI